MEMKAIRDTPFDLRNTAVVDVFVPDRAPRPPAENIIQATASAVHADDVFGSLTQSE